ncbi:MAG: PIN domain-containing protein [Nanoarchaeota archaeon]
MGMKAFFFDTHALIELVKANPYYRKYGEALILTSQHNLIEFYYSLIHDFDEKTAKAVYYHFKECVQVVSDDINFEAMEMKKKCKKRNLSYVDCIGYISAKQQNIKFLTGDKEFEHMQNVEFVK